MLAKDIFDPDIGALKEKATRHEPYLIVQNYIEIPKELVTSQRNVTSSIHAIKINGVAFLISVPRNLQYRTAPYVKNQTPKVYCDALSEVFRI
jgi:hypothetical protein